MGERQGQRQLAHQPSDRRLPERRQLQRGRHRAALTTGNGLGAGTYTFTVTATDAAGNECTLTYTQAIDTSSLLSGWSGANVTLAFGTASGSSFTNSTAVALSWTPSTSRHSYPDWGPASADRHSGKLELILPEHDGGSGKPYYLYVGTGLAAIE